MGIRHVLARCRPEYILTLNNDLVVAPDFLDQLVRAAESDRRTGIVGSKIYHYDYEGRRDVIWSAGGRIRWWALKVHDQLGEDDDDLPAYQTETEVDWISGCVMMFRSSLTDEIGLFNPWYFIGHEDVEYCLKAKGAGYKVVYVPTSRAWHKVGASRKKVYITFADPSSYYYLIRHNFPLPVYFYQLLLMPALMSRWALLYLAKHRDPHTLRRFLADFARMLWRRG